MNIFLCALQFGDAAAPQNEDIPFWARSPYVAAKIWLQRFYSLFVLEPEIFDYIEGDNTFWARNPLEKLSKDGQLVTYKNYGFWRCMDTLGDKRELEELWNSGNPPWRIWTE